MAALRPAHFVRSDGDMSPVEHHDSRKRPLHPPPAQAASSQRPRYASHSDRNNGSMPQGPRQEPQNHRQGRNDMRAPDRPGGWDRALQQEGVVRDSSWDRVSERPGSSHSQRGRIENDNAWDRETTQRDARGMGNDGMHPSMGRGLQQNTEWRGDKRPTRSAPFDNRAAGQEPLSHHQDGWQSLENNGSYRNMRPSWDRGPQQNGRRLGPSMERRAEINGNQVHRPASWDRSDSRQGPDRSLDRPQRFDACRRNSWDSHISRSPSDVSQAPFTPRSEGTPRDAHGPPLNGQSRQLAPGRYPQSERYSGQSRASLPARQWNGGPSQNKGTWDARMESFPPGRPTMERGRDDRNSDGAPRPAFRGPPEQQRSWNPRDRGHSQDRRWQERGGSGDWRRSNSNNRVNGDREASGQGPPSGANSRNARCENNGDSNTSNDGSARGNTLDRGQRDAKATNAGTPVLKKWCPPNGGNAPTHFPIENGEKKTTMTHTMTAAGSNDTGQSTEAVKNTHESPTALNDGRVPVVVEMKLPAALEVGQNLHRDHGKEAFTPELTDASTETDLRASASYSPCSVPNVVQSVFVSESPHSLTHPEDEDVTKQTKAKESSDAETKETPLAATENENNGISPSQPELAPSAAESDSDSSDSSGDETDEEELTRFAQMMFGIVPQQPVPQPRRDEESLSDADDVDSSDDDSESEAEEPKAAPKLRIKLSITKQPTKSSVKKKAPASRKRKSKSTRGKAKGAKALKGAVKEAEVDPEIEAEEAKRKKELAKPLTAAEIKRILGEEKGCCGPTSTHWVRRSVRQPSRSALNHPNVRSLLDKLRVNDYDMVVLKMKKYLSDPDTPQMIIDAALDAMEENTNCQALYIQNFNQGMRDEQVLHLLKILQMPSCNIWCLNIGETYNVKTKTWKLFAKGLQKTKITHMYASEHTISGPLKEEIRETIRKNRSKHDMHINPDNLDIIVQCTHCWWNPINAKVLRPYLKKRGLAHILEDKEAQGLPGSSSIPPAWDAGHGESSTT